VKIITDPAFEGGGAALSNDETIEAVEAMEEKIIDAEKPSPKETVKGFGLGPR